MCRPRCSHLTGNPKPSCCDDLIHPARVSPHLSKGKSRSLRSRRGADHASTGPPRVPVMRVMLTSSRLAIPSALLIVLALPGIFITFRLRPSTPEVRLGARSPGFLSNRGCSLSSAGSCSHRGMHRLPPANCHPLIGRAAPTSRSQHDIAIFWQRTRLRYVHEAARPWISTIEVPLPSKKVAEQPFMGSLRIACFACASSLFQWSA